MIYQCLYCPFSTERKYNLKVHEERKHRRNIEYKGDVNEELDEESSISDLKDIKAQRDRSILDVDTSRNDEKRRFSDIATDLHDTINVLDGLKDEYLEALPQLRKLKGRDLKTALNDYAALKANVALVTTGLEEDSGKKVDTTENVSDEEDTNSLSSDPDERDASTDDNSSVDESSKSSMQDDDEEEDEEDSVDESSKSSMQDDDEEEDIEDTDREEEDRSGGDETDDENEDNMEVDNVEQSKGDYWDFVQEAEYFVKRRDKKLMEKLIRKMKGYYAGMYEHDSKDLESMKQVYKDLRKVKSQVRQDGVGYLSLCSKRKIASMCLSAKLLKDIFDENEMAFKSKFPNPFHRFMKRVGYNAEKLNDPNISTHMKRRLLQKGDICRGILDGVLEFLIPFMKE